MRRRRILAGGAAMGLFGCSGTGLGSASSIEDAGVPTIDPGQGPLGVVVEYRGDTYRYDESNGTDLGDYTDPSGRFVQRCVRTEHQHFPLTIFFRPDRTTNRAEVVFELGNPWSDTPPENLDAYRVTILRGGREIVKTEVPEHFWYSRWRWQSAPRPVVTTVSTLIRSNLLPHYDGGAFGNYARDNRSFTYTPMRMAGLSVNMGITGERSDIGPVTGWQADYICEGTNLPTVFAQAEASGTINFHVRDPHTGAPIDLINTYPKGGTYSRRDNSPYFANTNSRINNVPLQYDNGHNPTLTYLPFLLTGDPYYLEALQFQANADLMGPAGTHYRAPGRYLAWPLRDKFHVVKITPEAVPKWLAPRSYFQAMLNGQRNRIEMYMADHSDPRHYVFRLITSGGSQAGPGQPGGTYFDPWQEDFVAFIFGWGVQLGFTEWIDALNWKIDCTVQRTNGTSGWPRSHPTPYQVNYQPGCTLTAPVSEVDGTIQVDVPQGFLTNGYVITVDEERMLVTGGERSQTWSVTRGYGGTKASAHREHRAVLGDMFKSWAECGASNLATPGDEFRFMPGDPTGMNLLFHDRGGDVTYPSYTRGALAVATRVGAQGAAPSFKWLDEQMRAAFGPSYHLDRKWMVI